MNVTVYFENPVTEYDSLQLKKVVEAVQREGEVTIKEFTAPKKKGVKSPELLLGLSIVGTVLTAFDVLISTLTYLESTQPKYSITVKVDDTTYTLDKIPYEKIKAFKKRFEEDTKPDIQILIKNMTTIK
jgi:hypothetical protein